MTSKKGQASKGVRGLVAMCLLVLVAAACGGGEEAAEPDTGATTAPPAATTPGEPDHVVLELQWLPSAEHLGLYYGHDDIYKEASLELEIQPPPEPTAALKLVANGDVHLGVSFAPELLNAVQEGLPVVGVASIVPVPLAAFVASQKSGVKEPADLAGKKLGWDGIPKDEAMGHTIVEEAGLDPGDVKLVNVGFNLTASALSGQVDALIGAFRNGTAVEIELQTGEAPVVIPVNELGMPEYDELVLIANKDTLSSDPAYADMVKRFVGAFVAATEAGLADPEGGLETIQDVTEDDPKLIGAQFEATMPLLRNPNRPGIGCFDFAIWDELSGWMTDRGLLDEPVSSSEAVTNEYVPSC